MSYVYKYITLITFIFSSSHIFSSSLLGNDYNPVPGDKKNHALIIIDMQYDFIERGEDDQKATNIKKFDNLLAIQLKAIKAARESNIPILNVYYDGFGKIHHGIKAALRGYDKTWSVDKNTDGLFVEGNSSRDWVMNYLSRQNVGTLIIVGASGGACVKKSIIGAQHEGFDVVALSKGIADFNYKDFIYPYRDKYTFSANTCREKDCSFIWFQCKKICSNFKEIDELSTYTFMIANGNIKRRYHMNESIINTTRGIGFKKKERRRRREA